MANLILAFNYAFILPNASSARLNDSVSVKPGYIVNLPIHSNILFIHRFSERLDLYMLHLSRLLLPRCEFFGH